jgi:hypothetical protein
MARKSIQITGVLGGISPSSYLYAEGQYLSGVGIDPDLPVSDADNDYLPSGVLRPSAYADFTDSVDDLVTWIITNPKDAKVYGYSIDGKVHSWDSSFASETTVSTIASASGNGAVYYNNYLYFITDTDVARYGPLNNSPSMTTGVWTGATLGSQTALTDTTYPTMRQSVALPNHVAHVHGDGALYFCDFAQGQGLIHKIRTKKTTDEGDTDNTSLYNALDLPFGYKPTAINSYGTDLVVAAIQTNDANLSQGESALFFWDAISPSFYRRVPVPDTLITAIVNVNGVLYVFSGGTGNNGYRVSAYTGGAQLQTVYVASDGYSPLPGAATAIANKVIWGTTQKVPTTGSPEYYSSVMALGAIDPRLPTGAQPVANLTATTTSTNGVVGAVLHAQQGSYTFPKVIASWKDGSTQGIDKRSTTYGTSIFQSPLVTIGSSFTVVGVRFALAEKVAANMTITPTLFMDSLKDSSALTVMNNTNFANSERIYSVKPNIKGYNNLMLELRWSGTALAPVLLPIIIDVEIDDEPLKF